MLLFLNRARAVFMALSVHVIFAVILLYGITWSGWKKPTRPEIMPAIQATIVDVDQLVRGKREREQTVAREAARERRLEQQRQAALQQQEREREAEVERQRQNDVAERQARADETKAREQARLDAQKKVDAEAAAAQQEMDEINRLLELKEAERQELEDRVNKQREDELIRQAADLKAAEDQKLADDAAQEAAALESSENATLRDKYIATIRGVVTSNWNRPPSVRAGLECQVVVQQIPGGEVISAQVASPCNADEVTQRSIIQAVRRSEPLPSRGFESVFESRLTFTFSYDG